MGAVETLHDQAEAVHLRAFGALSRWSWRTLLVATVGLWWLYAFVDWWQAVNQPGGVWTATTPSDPYHLASAQLLMLVPWALTIRTLRSASGGVSKFVVGAWALVAMPLLLSPPTQSHDVMQYVVYGHLQSGPDLNPYLTSPAAAGDNWLGIASWPDTRAVYGPLWLLALDFLVGLAGTHLVLAILLVKFLAVALVGVAAFALLRLRADDSVGITAGGPATLAFLLLNPLVVTSVALGGHLDAALAAAFLLAMLADQRRRPIVALVLLLAACLVKAYAVLVLGIYLVALWRRGERKSVMLGLAISVIVTVIAYAPYWAGAATLLPLRDSAGMHDPTLFTVTGLRALAPLIVLTVAVVLVFHRITPRQPWFAAAILLGTFMFVSGWFLPWYLVGLVALVAPLTDKRIRRAVAVGTGTSFILLPTQWLAVQTLARYAPVVLAWNLPTGRVSASHSPDTAPTPDTAAGQGSP
ncbi:MAG TPA: hypothetical protein VMT88_01560 [Actinomycetes bacterium]|nr:hypothetical protein [Actinomycetes bacterium]